MNGPASPDSRITEDNAHAAEFLNAIVDVAQMGICIADENGTLVRTNPAFCAMTQYSDGELVGQHFSIVAPPELQPRLGAFLAAVLEESPRVREEWRLGRRDGALVEVLAGFRTLTMPGGKRYIVATFADLTRRKESESSLRESEERFRQLAESIAEVFWISNPDKSQMIYVSPAYATIWGRGEQTVYDNPRSFLDSIHPEDRPRIEQAMVLQREGGYHEEYRIVRPDGAVRWIRDRAFPVRDAQGQVYRITGIATDITERRYTVERIRQLNAELEERIVERTAELTMANARLRGQVADRERAEASLRVAHERLARLIETANDAVVTIDQQSNIIEWNAMAERMFGWSQAEVRGRLLTELIVPPQHRESHHRGLQRFLRDGSGGILNRRVEITAIRRDGTEFDVELAVWPVRAGETFTFSSFIRDISARKAAQEALQSSEERYRAVVENAAEGIIVSQDGFIRFVNPAALALSGRSREEALTTPFIELVHPDDRARVYDNYVKRLKGEPTESQYVFRIFHLSGEVRWLEISAVMIQWAGKPGTLNFLTDVTDRQRIEEELRQSLTRERELSDLKSRFVAMASHEFRTPLATIFSSAELIEDHGARLPAPERAEVIGLIKGAVKRMTEMVEQVLLIGRAEAGGLDFNPAALDAGKLCRALAEDARRNGAVIGVEVSGQGPVRMLDEKLLRHILGNLLSNAVKYSPQDGRGTRGIALKLACDPDALTFRVQDHGIGIPEADLTRMYDSFHRGANVGGIEGTGLGLAIVRECVQRHGGSINVESRVGQGSLFTVRIPVTVP
ncbi:MAG: domain S-box protein [Betaproteobacteria bacterium]|nr:domain S-box protein [Betaproteobacteria bacterium]